MGIQKDTQYGDFITIKRFKDEGKYGCECEHCGKRKKFTEAQLIASPRCQCQIKEELNTMLSNSLENLELEDSQYSMFMKQVEQISKDFEDNQDKGISGFQLQTLKMLVDLIPYAERQYRNDPRQSNAYSINALVTQVRELIADLQAEDDTQEMLNDIIISIIQPMVGNVANEIIQFNFDLRRDLERYIPSERIQQTTKIINDYTKELARGIKVIIDKAQQDISEIND